jgi:hypothetical protein
MTTTKQLDDATRRALLAGQDPPRGAQERVLRAILAAGPPGDGGGEGGELGGGELGGGELGGGELGQVAGAGGRALELGFAAKVVGTTIGLTAAGLVTLALASAGVRSLRTDAPVSARPSAREHAPAPAPLAAAEPKAVPDPPTLVTPTSESSESSESSEPSAKSITTSVPVEPKSITTTSLEAELALMQDARAAQAPAARLALLERHAREFAGGVLADEREVLRVETLCALGRVGDAEVRAAAFVAANPSHPLRSRVEPACEK